MKDDQNYDWLWFRCSIMGCGAGPLRVRRHPYQAGKWSVGFTDSPLWAISGPVPRCPTCGSELERLASGGSARAAA